MRGIGKYFCLILGMSVSLEVPYALHAQLATPAEDIATANQLYATQNYTQAGQYYYSAIKLDPTSAAAYQGLGDCYYFTGRKADALTCFQKALSLQPNNPQLGQFVQSLKANLSNATAVASTTGASAAAGAAPAGSANTPGTAPGTVLQTADPLNQGAALFKQKQYAAAIRYFMQAAQQNPNDYRPYYYSGYAYYLSRDARDAALCFAVANLKHPDASVKSFADRIKATLQPAGQQWVDSQSAKYAQGPAVAGVAAADPLRQGAALFQQKQYAASIPYFLQAAQQNPGDYRPYYYAGYAYYMSRDTRDAALCFAVANLKHPDASVKAFADQNRAILQPADQQWVDSQLAKYAQGPAAAGGAGKGGKTTFGFHLLGGAEYILSDPTAIKDNAKAGKSVSLTGVIPNVVGLPEIEPFIQIGDNFEVNLAVGYFPVGNMNYTSLEYNPNYPVFYVPDTWKYTFNTTIITADLGVKLLLGGKSVKGYLGVGGGISPINMTFTKANYDPTGITLLHTDSKSGGTYNTMAVNGQAILGADFSLTQGMALGPYVGYRYLSATDFLNNGSKLLVDTKSGAVGVSGSLNMPSADPVKPLTLDFSGIEGGLNLTFSF